MKKERLDVLMVSRGLSQSREKAKAVIMSGNVYVDGQKEDKAGSMFSEDCDIDVRVKELPFVSRGGLKLAKAIKEFDIALSDKVCMDIGASTGGFTDCMLQNGASKVYSVDVGHGQLDWKLRNDPRVVCMEKFNVRYIEKKDIEDDLDFAGTDVSFISLTKILEPVKSLLKDNADMVCPIKPQFEAGREQVGKHGVVRDKKVHIEVIERICSFTVSIGLDPIELSFSPIRGPEGNIEYLLHLKNNAEFDISENDEIKKDFVFPFSIVEIVEQAHGELDR